jgi:hypothetical protein
LARERNYIFQEVSAKTGVNINNLFYQDIFNQIAKKLQLGDGEVVQNEPVSHGIKLGEENVTDKPQKKKCC